MAYFGAPLAPGAHLRFGSLDFIFGESEEPLIGATFVRPEPTIDDGPAASHDKQPEAP